MEAANSEFEASEQEQRIGVDHHCYVMAKFPDGAVLAASTAEA